MELTVNKTATTVANTSALPPEYQALYDTLYLKVSSMMAGHIIDLKTDPTLLLVIIKSAMTIVESFRSNDKPLDGTEKRCLALTLVKLTITDLAKNGKIGQENADDILKNIDLYGGITMDIAVSAAKGLFYIGGIVKDEVVEFATDAKKVGCKGSCAKNCCMF
jgi:hypothetical protein